MLGSTANLAWNLPTTVVGWFVYIISKLLVAGLNILIFHCFILQAKINVQDDPKYVEATKILDSVSPSDTERIQGPEEYFRDVYGKKGIAVFTGSLLSAVGLTQAVLTFDWVSMLTYFFPSQIETVLLKEGYEPNYQIIVDRVKNNDTFDVNVEMTAEKFTDKVGEVMAMEKSLANAMKTMLGIFLQQ